MALPNRLRAREGELILPKWEELQDFMRQYEVVPGPEIRIETFPDGTHVYGAPPRKWPHPFKVRLQGMQAVIGKGFVNGVSPTIQGVPLEGVDAQGNAVEVPPLDLEPGAPKEANGFSWVGLRWLGLGVPCEIVAVADEGKGLPLGFHPLARILWEGGYPSRSWQIAYHNCGAAEVEGRVYFWAAS